MNEKQLKVYNEISKAAVRDDRALLARGLHEAWKMRDKEFVNRCMHHAAYVGWPVRRRPNGRWT
jgi:hypothetical protein